jgi:hypothetical protein
MALLRLEQNGASGTRRSARPSLGTRHSVLRARGRHRKMIYTITAVETQRRSLSKIKPLAFGTPLRGLGA